jgi:hypothetical protein
VSDLNDLIHINARNAFDQGVKTERERILRLLIDAGWFYEDAVKLIKDDHAHV